MCVMVRRLADRFIGECSWYFRCLCAVYWFVNPFVHQNVKYFIQKIQKYAFTDSFRIPLTVTCCFGNLTNVEKTACVLFNWYNIIFSETSIFTLPGVTLHKDPGLRSSGLSSSGRHKSGTYHASSRMLIT